MKKVFSYIISFMIVILLFILFIVSLTIYYNNRQEYCNSLNYEYDKAINSCYEKNGEFVTYYEINYCGYDYCLVKGEK